MIICAWKGNNKMDDFDYTAETLNALWSWEVEQEIESDLLFHYYSADKVVKVFTEDGIRLRLAEVSTYTDTMEGIAVNAYYDLALEELHNEGIITSEQYDQFCKVAVPESLFMPNGEINGIRHWSRVKYRAYTMCFSTSVDDPFMFGNYGNGGEGERYCLHFTAGDLADLKTKGLDNDAEINLVPIKYGRSAIDFIKGYIIQIISNPYWLADYEECICNVLQNCHYTAKLSKHSKENEIRLVVFLPVGGNKNLPDIKYDSEDDRYIYFTIPKYMLYSISPSPDNTVQQTNTMVSYLETNGYILHELNNSLNQK